MRFSLREVVVTAEKRQQNEIEVPASMSVIGTAKIESEKINSLRNLSGLAPNFYMPEYGSKLSAPVYIRGIGARINNPSVGLYVDGVPYFDKSPFSFDFLDIERVEILKGPQGTLYGRNTIGGAINIITQTPLNTRQTKFSADFGNYGLERYKFSHIQPLVENKLSLLISAGYIEHNGYFTNKFDASKVGGEFTKNGSFKIRYQPYKPLTFTYKISAEQSKEKANPYAIYDSAVNYNHSTSYARDLMDNSLSISYKKNKVIINSVSSYQYFNDKLDVDYDYLPRDWFFAIQPSKQNLLAQEITVSSAILKNLDITAGVFGFIQRTNRDLKFRYGVNATTDRVRPPFPPASYDYDQFNFENNRGSAVFGQITLKDILQIFELTAGIRYDNETNILDYKKEYLGPSTKIITADTTYRDNFEHILPKFSIRAKVAPNMSVYATTSKGYKSGGFNIAYELPQDLTYKPESNWNYEIGFKADILPGKVTTTLALFYIDWNNQQVSQMNPNGRGFVYRNAKKTYNQGIEAEVTYKIIKSLTLGGNIGYTEAKYKDYTPVSNTGLDYNEKYLPFIPRYTFSTFAVVKHELSGKYLKALHIIVSLNGIGKIYWNDENSKSQNPYQLTNARIGLETVWAGLYLWGKNIFNAKYRPYANYVSEMRSWLSQEAIPATYGLTFSVKL